MTSLGALYQHQNRFDESEKLLEKTVAAMRETLGSRHPQTLQAIGNLAAIYGVRTKRPKPSRSCSKRLLPARKRERIICKPS